jgi:hypothetical protein
VRVAWLTDIHLDWLEEAAIELIKELAVTWPDPDARLEKLNALGDEAAASVARVLPEALDRFESVVFLTHVPPFEAACRHEGRISDKDWLPHFTCKAVGDVLVRRMRERPDRRLTVLCGHTHGNGVARILPNLEVRTGGARPRQPEGGSRHRAAVDVLVGLNEQVGRAADTGRRTGSSSARSR